LGAPAPILTGFPVNLKATPLILRGRAVILAEVTPILTGVRVNLSARSLILGGRAVILDDRSSILGRLQPNLRRSDGAHHALYVFPIT
jgi:hypothetical protein